MGVPKRKNSNGTKGRNGKPSAEQKRKLRTPPEATEEKVAVVQATDADLQTPDQEWRPPFPIVGIGASAGGLEALESLIKRLRVDNMAFVVIQHLSPQHQSALESLLSRHTSLPVLTATNEMKVEPNHIYIIPPGSLLSIENGVLNVDRADWGGTSPRLVIDVFLRSLAKDQGPGAIGVILSGTGTDGTFGMAAIKAAGGITFVQEPSTATYPGMPQSALDSGFADFALAPERIADELMRVTQHPYVAATRPPISSTYETFSKVLALLRHAFGIDFALYKHNTIERRMERRMALNRIERMDEYLKLLQANPVERSILFKDLLINMTSFFRDREPYEDLKTNVFPQILEGKPRGAPIRIWVPGCSTGEETYSIAMCLLEFLGDKASEHKVQIFGTDVDSDAITFARAGIYPQNIELDVSPDRLQRFFSALDKRYQVSKQIRQMVVFAVHDLTKEPPFSRQDLVSCRNVLIYMQPELQRKILRIFHYALNPSAFLLLGSSESVGDASGLFNLVDRKLKLYIRKNTPVSAVFDLRLGHETALGEVFAPGRREIRNTVSVQQLADRKVIERYGPPGVLVNENMEVLQFRGKTGEFLEHASGGASLSLLKLVRPELLIPLRTTMANAQQTGHPASSGPIQLSGKKRKQCIIDVLVVHEPGSQARCFLVLFNPSASSAPVATRGRRAITRGQSQALERELATTKEYLQSVIEELESSNEELQSSNEELQSSNEELQSTNEELQTSTEELQSTNEELATVNEELQNRMLELSQFKDDLQNIIESVDTPVILLGMDLRVRGLTSSVSRALNLASSDIGRPIGHFLPATESTTLESRVSEVIKSLKEQDHSLEGKDGHSYLARIKPYKTSDHRIKGAVISLVRAEKV